MDVQCGVHVAQNGLNRFVSNLRPVTAIKIMRMSLYNNIIYYDTHNLILSRFSGKIMLLDSYDKLSWDKYDLL